MEDFILLALHSWQGLLSRVGIETCDVEGANHFKVIKKPYNETGWKQ
jgi:hypothetical protein